MTPVRTHSYHNGSCTVCLQPQWGRLSRGMEGLSYCPGVHWLRVNELIQFPYLATVTTLQRLKHKAADMEHPAACYYSGQGERYIYLYDVRDALPKKPISPKQRETLAEARRKAQAARSCTWCQRVFRAKSSLQEIGEGHSLCHDCTRQWKVCERARRMLASPEAYVVLDTETTGLEHGSEIIEIAVVRLDGTVLLNTLVSPTIPIAPDAYAVHGTTDDEVRAAPSFAEIYPQLVDACAGRTVIIYNQDFDLDMLSYACQQYSLAPFDGRIKACVCAMRLYARYIGDWSRYLGRYRWAPLPGAGHRAVGDCQAVVELLHQLAQGLPTRSTR